MVIARLLECVALRVANVVRMVSHACFKRSAVNDEYLKGIAVQLVNGVTRLDVSAPWHRD